MPEVLVTVEGKRGRGTTTFPIGSLLTRFGGGPADLELDSVAHRPESPPFSVAINYDSIVSSAKATGLRGGFCEKVQEKKQNRDARRSGFRLLRSRPRRKHSRVSRRPRRT